jgi:hypothetical protein
MIRCLKVTPCAKRVSRVAIKMHSLFSKQEASTESGEFIGSLWTSPLYGKNCAF